MNLTVKCIAGAAMLAACAAAPAQTAGDYPNRLIRIIVPFVAGGPTDVQARWAAQQLNTAFNQPVVIDNWNDVLAPAGTPKAVIAKIHELLAKQLATAEARELFVGQGHELSGIGPEDYAAFIKAETEKWARIARKAGIPRT